MVAIVLFVGAQQGACTPATGSGLAEFPPVACPDEPERCDGIDNDCDGDIDEAAGLLAADQVGVPCGDDLGLCRPGIAACVEGQPVCDGGVRPGTEGCTGQDEDCDGETDERADLAAAGVVGVPCGSDEGACERGIIECLAAQLLCDGGAQPGTELCNGVDDDCDGDVDEEVEGLCEACVPEGATGLCRSGVRLCEAGVEICTPNPPQIEVVVCDLLDNDCDGAFDEAGEAAVAVEGPMATARDLCGPSEVGRGGLPEPVGDCSAEPGGVGCDPVHACLPPDCLRACRQASDDDALPACLQACAEQLAQTGGAVRWRCAGGVAGPACAALECTAEHRLQDGACVPDVEICNNGLDDDRDGLIDGTLAGPDPCAATIDQGGERLQFGTCVDPADPGCEDTERLFHEWEEQCLGDDCPFRVGLSYAYALDREEVSMRAYRQCVEAGCCEPPAGRLWTHVSELAAAGPLPRRPSSPPRCMPPPVIVPDDVDPAHPDLPGGAVSRDDPLLADLPVSSVSWCQARAYCSWAGKRMPTEYEWERAATGLGVRRRYAWGDDEPAQCPEIDCCRAPDFEVEGAPPAGCDPGALGIPICEEELPEQTRRRCLASFGAGRSCADAQLAETCPRCVQGAAPVWANEDGASPLGIVNLNGNVGEWVYDWHRVENHSGRDRTLDPVGRVCSSFGGGWRVQRGGAFSDSPMWLKNLDRRRAQESMRTPFVGFRCARTVDDAGMCDPGVPDVRDRCLRGGEVCDAPDFQAVTDQDLALCAHRGADRTTACPDPRSDYCPTGEVPVCGVHLARQLRPNPLAILKFIPRALLDNLDLDLSGFDLGAFDGAVDSTFRASLGPAWGDALLAAELPAQLGRDDGIVRGRLGPAVVDDQGALRFLGIRAPGDGPGGGEGEGEGEGDPPVCTPARVAQVEYRSEEGALDVRSLCGQSPWEFYIPEVASSLYMSAVFIEAERTAFGVQGAALAIVNERDSRNWTLGSPPVAGQWTIESLGLPSVSLCQLYDVLHCEEKPPGCPEGYLAPCPVGDPICNGYVLPFEVDLVPAAEAGIPGLTACEPPD